jgi:type IV fimbrial biogenesis protein FimT
MDNKQSGLTLVELMITLAVAITLLAVGMPLFTGVASNNRATAQTNALVTALTLTRSEAIGRAADVSIAAVDGDWAGGWSVFVDADADGVQDTGEVVIRTWEAPSGRPSISLSSGSAITFQSLGNVDVATPLTFELDQVGATGATVRCITVTGSGQIRTAGGACT